MAFAIQKLSGDKMKKMFRKSKVLKLAGKYKKVVPKFKKKIKIEKIREQIDYSKL